MRRPGGIKEVISVLLLLIFIMASYSVVIASEAGVAYRSAQKHYKKLKNSKTKKRYRHNWMKVIYKFEEVYKVYPKTSFAPKSLFMVGRLYRELYRYSRNKRDLSRAIEFYRLLVNSYPEDSLSDDAQFLLGEILYKDLGDGKRAYIEYSKVIEFFPRGDMRDRAAKRLKELKKYKPKEAASGKVLSIRHWSNPNYTRVVIDLNRQVSFKPHLLRPDPSRKKPPRLYIDLSKTRLKDGLKDHPINIGDGLLKKVRAGQYAKNTVRVVLDLESLSDYKVFSLNDPFRVVIDIKGAARSSIQPEKRRMSPPSLAQQFGLKIKKIILDPGHGGRDPGAIGKRGLREKDVVLRIAKILKRKLKAKGYEVLMTRDRDVFIPLEERTAFANTKEADLFISIHANASPKRTAYGIETYYLNFTTNEESMRVAARENATSGKKMGDLQYILYDLMQTSKVNESSKLAFFVQNSLTRRLSTRFKRINNLGVKQAPFYVLIGANMPSILVEVSFISNPSEEKRLRNSKYLHLLSDGIVKGIDRYVKSMRMITVNDKQESIVMAVNDN